MARQRVKITTKITRSRKRTHRNGTARKVAKRKTVSRKLPKPGKTAMG